MIGLGKGEPNEEGPSLKLTKTRRRGLISSRPQLLWSMLFPLEAEPITH
jgi:hypothetical protein